MCEAPHRASRSLRASRKAALHAHPSPPLLAHPVVLEEAVLQALAVEAVREEALVAVTVLAEATQVAVALEDADKTTKTLTKHYHTDLLEGYFLDSRRAAPVMKRLVAFYSKREYYAPFFVFRRIVTKKML